MLMLLPRPLSPKFPDRTFPWPFSVWKAARTWSAFTRSFLPGLPRVRLLFVAGCTVADAER
jgi:hypothetical protein